MTTPTIDTPPLKSITNSDLINLVLSISARPVDKHEKRV